MSLRLRGADLLVRNFFWTPLSRIENRGNTD